MKPSDPGTGLVTERFTVIVHFLNRSLMNTGAHVVWISQLFKQVMLLVFGPGGTIFYIVMRVTHMPQKKESNYADGLAVGIAAHTATDR